MVKRSSGVSEFFTLAHLLTTGLWWINIIGAWHKGCPIVNGVTKGTLQQKEGHASEIANAYDEPGGPDRIRLLVRGDAGARGHNIIHQRQQLQHRLGRYHDKDRRGIGAQYRSSPYGYLL